MLQQADGRETLIVVGASARSAAASAVRAGFRVACADLFADADLEAICPVRVIRRYPHGIPAACRSLPPGPWMYTGGLENHPDVVDRLAARRELLGNSGAVLRGVRDPELLRDALRESGLPAANVSLAPPAAGRWLRKPRASAAGTGIQFAENSSSAADRRRPAVYYQEFVEGDPESAVFVAAEGRAALLGICRQLVGCQWAGAEGFRFVGAIGCLSPPEECAARWRSIGDCLSRRFALRGLFGVDAVTRRDTITPVEVNPRYTASVEVIERATGAAAIARHLAAFGRSSDPARGFAPSPLESMHGKAVVYARKQTEVSSRFFEWAMNEAVPQGHLADISHAGTIVRRGRPLVTVLAPGDDAAAVQSALRAAVDDVYRRLE